MKIAIISTQFAINYGAVLQAIALKKSINNLGYECEILDFRPINNIDGRKTIFKWNNIKSIVYSSLLFLNFKFRKERQKKILRFNEFVKKNGCLSKNKYNSYKDLKDKLPHYDVFVCGSDQIWNLNLFDDLSFFLKFEDKYPKSKFIAYAPSITEKLKTIQLKKITENISHFTSISVREKIGSKQLSEHLGYKVKNVLDPVFLLSKKQWLSLEEPLEINESYILNYGLVGGKNTSELLNKAKKRFDLKVVNVNIDPFNKFNADYNLTNLSPGNFIWLVRNADFVISSSFHGMVFAIVFQKQFLATPASFRSSRHENVLGILNLENRLLSEKDDLNNKLSLKSIDYNLVQTFLNKAKSESIDYLKNAINDSRK